jgi:hypothetical protein
VIHQVGLRELAAATRGAYLRVIASPEAAPDRGTLIHPADFRLKAEATTFEPRIPNRGPYPTSIPNGTVSKISPANSQLWLFVEVGRSSAPVTM